MTRRTTPTELLSHADGLRRLAHVLVRQAADADDALQETLLRALEQPPRQGETTGPWLKQVLRNVVRKSKRQAARRSAREQAHGQRPPAPAPLPTLERVEQASQLIAALRTLSPDKREVLALRYFESLPPRAIAARLGIPVETAKTRQKRALAELRQTLDTRDQRAWPVAFALSFGMTPAQVAGTSTLIGAGGAKLVALLLLASLGIAAAIWGPHLVSGSERAPDGRADAPETADALAALEDEGSAASLRGHAPRRVESRPSAVSSTGTASEASGAPSPTLRRVGGTATFLDRNGETVALPEATLRIVRWQDEQSTPLDIPIRDGAWTAELSPDSRIEFETITFGEQVGRVVSPFGKRGLQRNGRFEVEARLREAYTLRVLDAETGRELRTVFVQVPATQQSQYLRHPGSQTTQMRGPLPSPVSMLPTRSDLVDRIAWIRVGAPGYAWRRTGVDLRTTASGHVELERAGSVALTTQGPPPPEGALLYIRKQNERGWTDVAHFAVAPGTTQQVEGLAPGRYQAGVEMHRGLAKPVILGQVTFEITVAHAAEATLRYKALVRPKTAPLSGTIRIPEGWDLSDLALDVDLQDTPLLGQPRYPPDLEMGKGLEAVPGEARTFRFDAGRVQVGRYELNFHTLGLRKSLVVGAEGIVDLRVDLPTPVAVRLRLEDEPAEGPRIEEISWRGTTQDGFHAWGRLPVERNPTTGVFSFRAPPGAIEVTLAGAKYLLEPQTFEVSAPHAELTFRVPTIYVVHVRMVEDGRELPWRPGWDARLAPVEHAGVMRARGGHRSRGQIMVSAPGRYRLDVDPIEGYEAILPRVIEIGNDPLTVIDVEIRRRP